MTPNTHLNSSNSRIKLKMKKNMNNYTKNDEEIEGG